MSCLLSTDVDERVRCHVPFQVGQNTSQSVHKPPVPTQPACLFLELFVRQPKCFAQLLHGALPFALLKKMPALFDQHLLPKSLTEIASRASTRLLITGHPLPVLAFADQQQPPRR